MIIRARFGNVLAVGVLTGSLFVLGWGSPTAQGRPGAKSRSSIRLGHVNVIQGSSIKGIAVHLPKPATVSLEFGPKSVQVKGVGRVAGLVLSRADVDNLDRPILYFLRQGLCKSKAKDCETIHTAGYERDGKLSVPKVARLPAGDYTLYLIADRKPITVTLRLGGLSGRTAFRPDHLVHAGINEPPVHLYESVGSTLYSNGQVVDFSGESAMWMTSLWMHGDAWVAGQYGHCIYRDVFPPPPVGFAPDCPGGGSVSTVDVVVQPFPYEKVKVTGTFASAGGRWGFGDYYVSAALAEKPSALAFFLAFSPSDAG